MSRRTSNSSSKRKRTIKPRSSGDGAKLYWSMVQPQDWLDFCATAVSQGISVTPSARRDNQALAVRFWHPDFELETVYFGIDEHGDPLPESCWEYLAMIIGEITGKEWAEVLDQLKET